MIGLCCNKTYGAMAKYNNGDDDGDNDENKDGNDDYNASAGSRSDGPIFNLITTHRSHIGLTEEDLETMMTAMELRRTIYLRVGL